MSRTMLLLAASLSSSVLAPVARAQSPVGAGAKSSKEAPPTERVDTRFGTLFPSEELIRPEPEIELPPAPSAFQTRAQVCFEESRQRDPGYAGRLEISVNMLGGRIVSATATQNTTGDPVLAECVNQRAIGFPMADGTLGDQHWVFVVGAQ